MSRPRYPSDAIHYHTKAETKLRLSDDRKIELKALAEKWGMPMNEAVEALVDFAVMTGWNPFKTSP